MHSKTFSNYPGVGVGSWCWGELSYFLFFLCFLFYWYFLFFSLCFSSLSDDVVWYGWNRVNVACFVRHVFSVSVWL